MSIYVPDSWVVLEIYSSNSNETVYKVLAGWYGGYLNGDSWKLNSGITRCEYDDEYWYFYGYSGSVYKCHREAERMSSLMTNVFLTLSRDVDDLNNSSYVKVLGSYEKSK